MPKDNEIYCSAICSRASPHLHTNPEVPRSLQHKLLEDDLARKRDLVGVVAPQLRKVKETTFDEFNNVRSDVKLVETSHNHDTRVNSSRSPQRKQKSRDDDVIFKIAYLAARISVLNQRIQILINENSANDNLIRETNDDSSNIVEKIIKSSKKPKDVPVEWVRVQIKETTEVNGVRFPSGIQIDVTDEDAKQMIEGNKAM